MTLKHFPPYPALPSLRLATAKDLPRLADLSVLGFKDSEIFRFERPGYDKFPRDAVASFSNIFRSQLLDPRAIVIVAEDWYRPNEASHFSSQIDEVNEKASPPERVVVGVASWVFPEGSPRTGQFVVSDLPDPEPTLDRDLCKRRLDLFTRVSEVTEKKYLAGCTICNKLVVHPSYQRRGHATAMLRWGLQLSVLDKVNQGVIPSHVGQPVYLAMGYKIIGEMHVPDDGDVKGFTQRIVLFKAE